MGMGEFLIWADEGARLGRWTIVAGAAWVAGDGVCCILSLKIAANSVRAAMVSSQMLANGTNELHLC
jgi:DNA replicative helicase MCM subunit Mcm2 (Cdc46/Mcm family)